ncbi:MAG: hypothetical protein ACR2QH_01635 [Geminicoccaceae bacterium]
MTDRLEEIKTKLHAALDDHTVVNSPPLLDMEYLITRLEAAEAVVEAARKLNAQDRTMKAINVFNALEAYDKVKAMEAEGG